MSDPARPSRLRGLFTVRRAIMSVVLSAGLAAVVVGFLESADPEPAQSKPSAIITYFPKDKDVALRQQKIGFQLSDDYSGSLRVDGSELPLDQLQRASGPGSSSAAQGLSGLNEVSFTPGDGKAIVRLAPGAHTATAIYWLTATQKEDDAALYTWSFSAT